MKDKDMEKENEIKTVIPVLRFPEFIKGLSVDLIDLFVPSGHVVTVSIIGSLVI